MRKVSFIMKKVVVFAFLLVLIGSLPLPNIPLSNNTAVAKASEVKKEKASDARLNYTTMKLVLEDSLDLSVRNVDRDAGETVTFKATDKDIISLEKIGPTKASVLAIGVGETSITVTVKDIKKKTLKTLTCSIIVGPPAQSIKFVESEVTISLNDTSVAKILKAIIKPGSTEEKPKITISKEGIIQVAEEAGVNTGIATVNVKALDMGTVTLTITLANGITDTCTIQVVE